MLVIDCDVVQKPRGEREIEMNVADRTELVLCIKRSSELLSSRGEREREMV